MNTAIAAAPTLGEVLDYRCPKHPDLRLINMHKGGAGLCASYHWCVQAAGVPEPKRGRPRAERENNK